MSSTISGDWEMSNLNAGPYWTMNSVWNKGNLVNGTDFTQSITSDDPNNPNMNTTISWNWPNTPAQYNVYSMPGVFYGTNVGFTPPANSVASEKISDIKTLTLSQDLTYSGATDHYDALYDMGLTSAPDGGNFTHEIEINLHSPDYMAGWLNSLPHQNFTDSNGMQWIIAENKNAGVPMVMFSPADFHDITSGTIDFKQLLDAAVKDGMLSGDEYFSGLGLGNEPQQGSGSMTIHSMHVNYDGDPNFTGATGGTQAGNPPAATDPGTGTPTTPVSTGGTPTDNGGGTTTATDGGGTMPGNGGGDTTANHGGGTQAADGGGGTQTAADGGTQTTDNGGGTQTATDGGTQTTGNGGGTQTATDGGTQTTDNGGGSQTATDGGTQTTDNGGGTQTATDGGTQTTGNGGGTQTASNGGGTTTAGDGGNTAADGGMGHGAGCGGGHDNHSHHHHDHSNGGGNMHNVAHDIVALLQAMQQNNTTAVNNAMTALGNDVHTAMDTGSSSGFAHHHFESHHHFEHMWG